MKKLFLISVSLVFFSFLQAQNKPLDKSVFDTWRSIESFSISDNGSWSFTQYKNKKDGFILVVKMKDNSFTESIVGGEFVKFFNNQKSAVYKVKDTLFAVKLSTKEFNKLGICKKVETDNGSPYLSYFKGKTLFIRNIESGRCDSIQSAIKSSFVYPKMAVAIIKRDSTTSMIAINLKNDNKLCVDTIYSCVNRYITDFSSNSKGSRILFFSAKDSLAERGIETISVETNGKGFSLLKLDDKVLPEGMCFNYKKGISFSSNEKYLKFEITSVQPIKKEVKKKEMKPAFEYEIWRWSDTLLPIQKEKNQIARSSLKCVYYPESGKFVQVASGLGVFVIPDENSQFGYEFNDAPYQFKSLWKYPLPKDIHCVNIVTGEKKILLKEFEGSFAFSSSSPQIFTYEPKEEGWFVTDINTLKKTKLSSKLPYPVKVVDFDEPQLPGSYGQAGMTEDGKYFIVYDQFDIWALPISGNGEPICLTNGFGRRNNIRFKILSDTDKSTKSEKVNLKSTLILESVNLDNRYAGFYRLEKGKNPVKLIEEPCKYSFVKPLGKDKYIIKRESFKESPDFWLADNNFKPVERLTDLNDQHKGYSFGDSKVITWNDSSGTKQTGILYTPENYDPSKKYPTIVYFYETMSQETYLFYQPAPTTSEINPAMFVSRGYVVFMPDIHYEIGWPGKCCVNAVVSGTKHLIDSGIIDPKRVGVEGHSWGGYQVAFLITQTNLFTCACSEAAVANMTSAYSGIRSGAGKPRMFMYECSQSRIGGNLWEKQENYIKNSPIFYLDHVTTPLLSRHSDDDEAVPYSQGLELFLGLKRLGKEVWMFNYKGDGHNIRKREIAVDWTKRMDEYFDYYLLGKKRPDWMR